MYSSRHWHSEAPDSPWAPVEPSITVTLKNKQSTHTTGGAKGWLVRDTGYGIRDTGYGPLRAGCAGQPSIPEIPHSIWVFDQANCSDYEMNFFAMRVRPTDRQTDRQTDTHTHTHTHTHTKDFVDLDIIIRYVGQDFWRYVFYVFLFE